MSQRRGKWAKVARGKQVLALLGCISLSCAEGPQLRSQISALEELTRQAEQNGAKHCAPRELAQAQSQLKFARIELEQGYASRAKHHVQLAEPNAQAAILLSPPEYCAARAAAGDRDGDGVLDFQDKCPNEPENFQGFQDEDGCPDDLDTDGDTIADSIDACVLEPEDKDDYLDDDGCPEVDNDLDGILDAADKCPNDPEDPDGYEDGDGCPDLDNDGDQVPDLKDECPNEPGSPTTEPLGCPGVPALAVVTDCEVKITQQIRFESSKAKIRPESYPVLDAVVLVLQKNPAIKLDVQGHTDNVGSAAYNTELSTARAEAVKAYLVTHGTDSSRLVAHGFGFDRPLVPNDSSQNRALNRRVQFLRTEGTKEGCAKP